MAINELWTERYRPKTIDEYVFKDAAQREQVEHWIKSKTIPHLLFSGSAGIGKTTLALILVDALGVDPYDVKFINASRERSINDMKNMVQGFCSTMPFGDLKVVILDEADKLSADAQTSLKGTMEEFSSTVRFIITTNHPNKVIPPIHSRCQGTHFEKIDHAEFTARTATVLITENVEFELEVLDNYVRATYPDLRKCLNLLQQNSSSGKLKQPSTADKSVSDYRYDMVKLFKAGKVREARTVLCSNVQSGDIDEIFRWMYDNLDLWSQDVEKQDQAIIIIRNGIANIPLVADQEINLSATLIELANL